MLKSYWVGGLQDFSAVPIPVPLGIIDNWVSEHIGVLGGTKDMGTGYDNYKCLELLGALRPLS